MATSTCVRCEGRVFDLAEVKPMDSTCTYFFWQCVHCGSVVSVLNVWHTQTLVDEIRAKLGAST